LLGGIGAHKFYLGQTTNATLPGSRSPRSPAFLGIIDGILMLRMTRERFAQRFG
jgi:TM2 domain-containing membrane protein YozV